MSIQPLPSPQSPAGIYSETVHLRTQHSQQFVDTAQLQTVMGT